MKPNRVQLGHHIPHRRKAAPSINKAPAEPPRDLDQPPKPPAEDILERKPRDLLFVHALIGQLDVPGFDITEVFGLQDVIPRDYRGKSEGAPYLLGSGRSCTVFQHETGDEAAEILPKGSIVALKRYSQDTSTGSLAADKDLALVIWQDLRVLCHPVLRSHENFCKLLFLGWEPYSIVPMLGLELAAYGSLKDALESEFQLSWFQKCQISMDITAGVYTLHSCGLLHGDIKPSNIMLQRHPERQIVAKLLDFSGVTDTARFGTASHRHFVTKLWLPPEVLLATGDLNWQYVDIYAYGLLITHMWCDIDFERNECFLQTLIPKYFTEEQKESMILFAKSSPETDEASVLSQALRMTKEHSHNPTSAGVAIPLEYILRSTLLPDPKCRKRIANIMPQFASFAATNNRDMPPIVDEDAIVKQEKTQWESTGDQTVFVFSDHFAERADSFKSLLLKYMVKIAGPPVLAQELLPQARQGTDIDFRDEKSLLEAVMQTLEAMGKVPENETYWRKLHFQIAVCYLLGYGTIIDETRGVAFLASAAFGLVDRAMHMFISIERSCAQSSSFEFPRLLSLALYCCGFLDNADILRSEHPGITQVMEAIHSKISNPELDPSTSLERQGSGHDADSALQQIGDVLESKGDLWDLRPVEKDPKIFSVIFSGDIRVLQELLRNGADPNQLNRTGLSPLHALTLIEDNVAAEMARLLLESGADATIEVEEPFVHPKNRLNNGWGTPLVWAIVKSKPVLFTMILEWCAEYQVEPPAGRVKVASLFLVTVAHRQDAMLAKLLSYRTTFKEEGKDMESPQYHFVALQLSIEKNDGDTLLRRWKLGPNFRKARKAVVRMLLELGADPLAAADSRETPLSESISAGDSICLEAFVELLKLKGSDLQSLLGRNGILKDGNSAPVYWSALYGSIWSNCMDAFSYLLREYPTLREQKSFTGNTPLAVAVSLGKRFPVESLLASGAKINTYNDIGSTPLILAISHGHLNLAELVGTKLDNRLLSDMGNTMNQVLHTYASGHRHIGIDSFELIQSLGGLTFMPDVDSKDTVWRILLQNCRPIREDAVAVEFLGAED